MPSFKKFLEDSGLVSYTAGHDNAAGWGLNGDKLDALLNYANSHLKAEDFDTCYVVDYVLDGSDYNDELLGSIAAHPEFFGNHIDEPKIIIKNIPLMNFTTMGADNSSAKIIYNDLRDGKYCSVVLEHIVRFSFSQIVFNKYRKQFIGIKSINRQGCVAVKNSFRTVES